MIYYYGEGIQSGISGSDTWAFQDSSNDSTKIQITSSLEVELSGVKIVYLQALTMELIDYVFQAMLPAAYEDIDNRKSSGNLGNKLHETSGKQRKGAGSQFVVPNVTEVLAVDIKLNNINLILEEKSVF